MLTVVEFHRESSQIQLIFEFSNEPPPRIFDIVYDNLSQSIAVKNWVFSVVIAIIEIKKLLVPHLKDLIHICLETEAQRQTKAFRTIFCRSKCPQIIS